MTSFCCTGTGPPSTRILEPAPDVLGARPRSRTATRGALARFWNTAAGPSRRLTTKSSAPSPSRSAVAIPCEMASSPAKPHLAPASLNVRSPLLRKATRSEEHTSELQSLTNLVCRLLLEKKKTTLQEVLSRTNCKETLPPARNRQQPITVRGAHNLSVS